MNKLYKLIILTFAIMLVGLVTYYPQKKVASFETKTLSNTRKPASMGAVGVKIPQVDTKDISQKSLVVPLNSFVHVSSSNRQKMNRTLENWLKDKTQENRLDFLNAALEDPIDSLEFLSRLINQIPDDLNSERVEILGLIIDMSEPVRNGINKRLKDQFFKMSNEIVEQEMSRDELIKYSQVENLSDYQLSDEVHNGKIVKVDNEYYISTLSNKIMALSLGIRNPNSDVRGELVKRTHDGFYFHASPLVQQSLNSAIDNFQAEMSRPTNTIAR